MKQTVLLAKIDESIKFWSHLVPAEKDSEITLRVNNGIRELFLNQKSQIDSLEKMKNLFDLICDTKHRCPYTNYVHMVFSRICMDFDQNFQKFHSMICSLSSCLGGISETYWQFYGNGYYDILPINEEEEESLF